jgi:hypothetical protein
LNLFLAPQEVVSARAAVVLVIALAASDTVVALAANQSIVATVNLIGVADYSQAPLSTFSGM